MKRVIISVFLAAMFARASYGQGSATDVMLKSRRPSVRAYLKLHGLLPGAERETTTQKVTAAGVVGSLSEVAARLSLGATIREINALGEYELKALERKSLIRDTWQTIHARIPSALACYQSTRDRDVAYLRSLVANSPVTDEALNLCRSVQGSAMTPVGLLDAEHCRQIYERLSRGEALSPIDVLDLGMTKRAAATVTMSALTWHARASLLEEELALHYSFRTGGRQSVSEVSALLKRRLSEVPVVVVPVSQLETVALTLGEFESAIGLIGGKGSKLLAWLSVNPGKKPPYRVVDRVDVNLRDVTDRIRLRVEQTLPDCSIGHDRQVRRKEVLAVAKPSALIRSQPRPQPADLGSGVPSLYTVPDFIERELSPVLPAVPLTELFVGFDIHVVSPRLVWPVANDFRELTAKYERPLAQNLSEIEEYLEYARNSRRRLYELLKDRVGLMREAAPLIDACKKSRQLVVFASEEEVTRELQSLFSVELKRLVVDRNGLVFERK